MKKILIADDQPGWVSFNVQAVREVFGEKVEIKTAFSAQEAYNFILENLAEPYDFIITDMQMEDDFAPKMAGEWLIEMAKNLEQYSNSKKIIIVSAALSAKNVAEQYGTEYIPKSIAVTSLEAYKSAFEG